MSNETQLKTETKKPLTLQGLLEGEDFKHKVAATLPKHLSPERFIRVAVAAMNRTPKLRQCTQASFFKCMIELSGYGLEPDGRRAYLIPFKNECTLIISYMGLIELCKRNGDVSNVFGAVVHENDFFEYDLGTARQITHKPVLKDRGDILGAYAVVSFKDGEKDFEFMSTEELNAIRDASQGYSYAKSKGYDNPWIGHWGEMAKKTAIRRLLKRQILSPEIRDAFEKEDTQEIQSHQQRAANAKPAEINPFAELPEEQPAIELEAATPVEQTREESDAAEYKESVREESE